MEVFKQPVNPRHTWLVYLLIEQLVDVFPNRRVRVFEMPNTSPTTTTTQALADKVARATHRMHCDFAFYVGATHENSEQVPVLESLPGSAGIKVFMGSSTGDLLLDDEDALQKLFAKLSRRAAFHSEDEGRLRARLDEQRQNDPLSHPIWRDEQAALQCTKRLLRLAHHAQRRVHVLHISTAEELTFLSDHKDLASIEATPHHLTLSWPEDYERLGTKVQMNPPVRGPEHRDALWRAIATGLVDVLGSDHAPHTLEEKNQPYPRSPSGMPGVQTLVPVMLDHVNAGRLSLQRFVDLTSHGPNRLFGLARKGRIARGYDADLTIVDLGLKREITDNWIASRCGWTPYHGKHVTGWPVGTIIRGQRVMWDGEIAAPAQGEPAVFASLGPKQISNP